VENQLRTILTVYLTVVVYFLSLHSSKIQILTAPVNHQVGMAPAVVERVGSLGATAEIKLK
jgi:hypothetical protein